MRRCLFCKAPSVGSRSVEHILPESLGNRNRTLSPGTVCDPCNNYFARKVEAPILEHDSFRNLRARWQIPNKQGDLPRWRGELIGANIPIGLRLGPDGRPEVNLERAADRDQANAFVAAAVEDGFGPVFAFQETFKPPKREMSRFLAKIAFEALAQRQFWGGQTDIDHLIDEPHWDMIRNWARRGTCVSGQWPFSERVIAPELTYMHLPESDTWVQAGFSYDIFGTKQGEHYFALVFHGYEWVINLGGPAIKGYEEWLVDNDNISPLVERVGMKVTHRDGPHGFAHYIDGEGDWQAGIDFDVHQVRRRETAG
jgi:hypothetical protein